MNDKNKEAMSKVKNLTIGAISSLGTVILYGTGVNLSKTAVNGKPIFIGTILLSFIAPHVLKGATTYIFDRFHSKNKQKHK